MKVPNAVSQGTDHHRFFIQTGLSDRTRVGTRWW
jgi:hypothetical protein